MMSHDSIYALYPDIVSVVGDIAYDAEGKEVAYDKKAVDDYEASKAYIAKRLAGYPPITDYIDGVVKNDQAQIDAYIAACQAIKAKYPK